jgi:PAS domain S-box-containing protein
MKIVSPNFGSVLDNSSDALYVVDADWRFVYLNPQAEHLLGRSRADLIQQVIWDIYPQLVDTRFYQQHLEAAQRSAPCQFETVLDTGHTLIETQIHIHPGEDGLAVSLREMRQPCVTPAALQAPEPFARAALDALSAHIAILDANGTIVTVNRAWMDFLTANEGDPTHAAEGTNYLAVCDAASGADAHYAHTIAAGLRAIISGVQHSFSLEYPCPSPGAARWFIARASRFGGDGVPYVVVAHEDITERYLAGSVEREQRLFAEALQDIAMTINSTLNLDEVLYRILAQAARVVPHDSAYITLIEGDNAQVVHKIDDSDHLVPAEFAINDLSHLRWIIHNHQPFIIRDTRAYTDWASLPQMAWVRSSLVAPLVVMNAVIGFLTLDSARLNAFTAQHLHRLQVFASQASIAIQNAQLYQDVRLQAQDLERRIIERTEQLHQVKEHVEAILNHNSDAIVLVGADACIKQTNPAFNELCGYVPDETFRRPVKLLVTDADTLQGIIEHVLTSGEPTRIEMDVRRKDGTSFSADIAVAPLNKANSQQGSLILSLRDITARKQMEEDLRRALEKERELNEMKSRFVSIVSHEFRTPLAVILSSAGLLKTYGDRMSEERKISRLSQIEDQVNHLTELIGDVLTITRAEVVGMDFEPVTVDLRTFCREVIDTIQLADGTRHAIQLDTPPGCNQAQIDPRLFRRALTNLLSNAIKYSPEGSVVQVRMTCDDKAVTLAVRDQGIGIPEEDLPHLFQSFQRAHNARSIPGTGLGLVIVKQIVEAHGGSIHVESTLGQGSTFTVHIPLQSPRAYADSQV